MLFAVFVFTLLTTDLIESISKVYKKCSLLYPVLSLLRHIDSKMIRDYIVFQTRLIATSHLESGLLTTNPTHCELVYFSGIQKYRVIFPKKRGPKRVVSVHTTIDDDPLNLDVTSQIFEYMGPSHNFHNIPSSPKLLGYKDLIFTMRNGDILSFSDEELIDGL